MVLSEQMTTGTAELQRKAGPGVGGAEPWSQALSVVATGDVG